MARSEEMFRAVCEQRDRACEALANLVDSFWSAHYNHAFDTEDTEEDKKEKDENGKPKTYRCAAGRSLRDCFHGCDLFGKKGVCKGYDCPMGFNHRLMYKRVIDAEKVVQENLAERIPLDFSRIPTYDPNKKYEVSVSWYARMLLLLFVEYSFTQEMTKERVEQFTNAFMSLCSIGLNSYKGIVTPIEEIKECLRMKDEELNKFVEDKPQIEQYFKEFSELQEDIEDKVSDMVSYGRKPYCNRILQGQVDNQSLFEYFLGEAITIQMEFEFDHDYPSADKAVYDDVFSSLKAVCVAVLGFKQEERFDIIQNLNNKTFDNIGFTERM